MLSEPRILVPLRKTSASVASPSRHSHSDSPAAARRLENRVWYQNSASSKSRSRSKSQSPAFDSAPATVPGTAAGRNAGESAESSSGVERATFGASSHSSQPEVRASTLWLDAARTLAIAERYARRSSPSAAIPWSHDL